MRISASGMSELVYVNSGAIYQLQSIRNRTGSYILTAAVNNEYRQAAMAVLSTSAPPSTSPQTGWSEFQCIAGCPPATPYRYFLMPHSEVGIASGAPYNEARYIHLRPGGITVDVRETSLEMQRSLYDFSNDFKPERAAYCSGYRAIHERFEKEGRLHHRYEDCPERKTEATLRACDDLGNWRTEKIPLLRPYE